ncbi:MAG: 4Fe-4S binding protein [Candidatus Asgardarchaeia archaeon]
MPGLGVLEKEMIKKKRTVTEMYPEVRKEPPEGFRGKLKFNIETCIGCGICFRVCPAMAIEMVESDRTKTKKKPVFYYDRCIFCGQCAESCPTKSITFSKKYELADYDKKNMIIDE